MLMKRERVDIPNLYFKYEEEFFDTVRECAIRIDKLPNNETRLYFHKTLSKVFLNRDKVLLMRLFRELITTGVRHGQESSR